MAERTCSIDGCSKKYFGRSYCNMHYSRWRRNGDPLNAGRAIRDATADERFWPFLDIGDCWLWTRGTNGSGYGCLGLDDGSELAHRYAWERLVGPISEGMTIDHLCRVKLCCNPDHMEVTTYAVNLGRAHTRAAQLAARTHCDEGHPFDEANTGYRKPSGRYCRKCYARRSRAYRQRKRVSA